MDSCKKHPVDRDLNMHGTPCCRELGPNEAPAVTSAAECCAACKDNPKCNVWNYCSDPTGCASAWYAPPRHIVHRSKMQVCGLCSSEIVRTIADTLSSWRHTGKAAYAAYATFGTNSAVFVGEVLLALLMYADFGDDNFRMQCAVLYSMPSVVSMTTTTMKAAAAWNRR